MEVAWPAGAARKAQAQAVAQTVPVPSRGRSVVQAAKPRVRQVVLTGPAHWSTCRSDVGQQVASVR